MKIDYIVQQLDGAKSWLSLEEVFGDNENSVVKSIIRHLRIIKAKSYILESHYIDRDYSTDYLQFYAQTFRSHDRHCKRVHFFSDDISKVLTEPPSETKVTEIQKFAKSHYCGFCIVRPLLTAPVGRAVLEARVRGYSDMEATVTCRASHDANLFGVDLKIQGTSFLQQDSRVGACAQVAIWVGMRHMHARYKYNWVSVADITQLAAPTTSSEATSLPAGSEFLTSERMIQAINEVGFQPLCFRDGSRMGAAILPYVESGIPVILGLNLGEGLGHAVTVIGRVFARQESPTNRAIDYVPAYIVHDDQAGPYMWLPMDEDESTRFSFEHEDIVKRFRDEKVVELNVKEHASFAIALMPRKVFSTAQAAEYTANDRIQAVIGAMSQVRQSLSAKEGQVNERLMEELELAHRNEEIVLRTYLTSAGGYRRHIAKGTASKELKDVLLGLRLPHFTWVTEISTTGSYNQFSPGMRRIYGHTVLDATSTGRDKSGLLILHIPGLVVTNDVNAPVEEQEKAIPIQDDKLYECREKRF